jgi:hypothetical protein
LRAEKPSPCDWIITNPPFADDAEFGDNATAFVLRLDLSDVSRQISFERSALLQRCNWALVSLR